MELRASWRLLFEKNKKWHLKVSKKRDKKS
jgi:hypothetical protein